MGIMVLFPPVSQDKVGYRAYNHSYYQITENSLHCPLGNISLLIDTSQGRTQYAIVPQYSQIDLIASTSVRGQGVVYELYPTKSGQGVYTTNTYSFVPGDNQLGFVANVVGKHLMFFSINNQASNAVIVDVQGSQHKSNGPILGQGIEATPNYPGNFYPGETSGWLTSSTPSAGNEQGGQNSGQPSGQSQLPSGTTKVTVVGQQPESLSGLEFPVSTVGKVSSGNDIGPVSDTSGGGGY